MIVAERAAGAHKLDYQPIADDIRAAIAVRHGVTVRDVLLVHGRIGAPDLQRQDRPPRLPRRLHRRHPAQRYRGPELLP